jgi:hypothetical protein
MQKVTGYETLQFDYRVTAEVKDVWGMAGGKEKLRNAKAEFIDKVEGEKIQCRRSKDVFFKF